MATHFFHSGMTNAPVLSGTAGALLAVLDACLVNGWGLVSVDSLVVSAGEATATISAGHSADIGTTVLIAGATPAGLSGKKLVTAKTNQTVKFDATGIADGAATGSITMKIASVGWAKEFSSGNVAVYHATDAAATQMRLRVDDGQATYARVVGYETMSSVDAGSNPFPTAAQIAAGGVWYKAEVSGATARGWQVYADDRAFYIVIAADSDWQNQRPYFFGDIIPVSSTDGFACGLFHMTTTSYAFNWASSMFAATTSAEGNMVLARSYTGVVGASSVYRHYDRLSPTSASAYSGSADGNAVPYPNPADSGLLLSPIRVFEGGGVLRGVLPGVYAAPQSIPNGAFAPMTAVSGVEGLPGRTLRAALGDKDSNYRGKVFFDATGPWR